MTTPADIIADVVVLVDGYEQLTVGDVGAQDGIIAALDAAGYQIVPKADRPPVCPECGSDNPRIAGGRRTEPCPDLWHGGAE